MQIRAAQRNPELRADWIRRLAGYDAHQLIFVDESAANEQTGNRKYGWAPIGETPVANPSALIVKKKVNKLNWRFSQHNAAARASLQVSTCQASWRQWRCR